MPSLHKTVRFKSNGAKAEKIAERMNQYMKKLPDSRCRREAAKKIADKVRMKHKQNMKGICFKRAIHSV